MPCIVEQRNYDGAGERLARLGLAVLWRELEDILTGFRLVVTERAHANSGAAVRKAINAVFIQAGWTRMREGGVDWIKDVRIKGTRPTLGVELRFSRRHDLLILDVVHLREQITAGKVDVGVLITPTDRLAEYLEPGGPRFSYATMTVERDSARYLPLVVLGLEHDGLEPELLPELLKEARRRQRPQPRPARTHLR